MSTCGCPRLPSQIRRYETQLLCQMYQSGTVAMLMATFKYSTVRSCMQGHTQQTLLAFFMARTYQHCALHCSLGTIQGFFAALFDAVGQHMQRDIRLIAPASARGCWLS